MRFDSEQRRMCDVLTVQVRLVMTVERRLDRERAMAFCI